MFCFNFHRLSLLFIGWLIIRSSFVLAQQAEKTQAERLFIAIPIAEIVLVKEDPYFVMLKRALREMNVEVLFVEMPGARSLVLLRRDRIAGSYPRYSLIADDDDFIAVKSFGRENKLYAYSSEPINDQQLAIDINRNHHKFGIVRGIAVMEKRFVSSDVHWFGHIEHLVGALKAGRVQYIIESDVSMERFVKAGEQLHRSSNPLFEGRATLLLSSKYKKLAVQLNQHFERFNY